VLAARDPQLGGSGGSAYGTGAPARLLCQQRPARGCRPWLPPRCSMPDAAMHWPFYRPQPNPPPPPPRLIADGRAYTPPTKLPALPCPAKGDPKQPPSARSKCSRTRRLHIRQDKTVGGAVLTRPVAALILWLDVGLGCSTRHVEIFFQAMLQMTWLRGMFGRQWVGRPGNAF
jgi:hypothetical protein